MFGSSPKSQSRRTEIHKNRPDTVERRFERIKTSGVPASIGIAIAFCAVAIGVLMLREDVVPYRPGQYTPHDIVSRVDFQFQDKQRLADAQRRVRESEPHVYRANPQVWKQLEEKLLALPDRVASASSLDEVSESLRNVLDAGTFTRLKELRSEKLRAEYTTWVKGYIAAVSSFDPAKPQDGVIVLDTEARKAEVDASNVIVLQWSDANGVTNSTRIQAELTFSPEMRGELDTRLNRFARQSFEMSLQPKVVALTLQSLAQATTHNLDEAATAEAQNLAASKIPASEGQIAYKKNQTLVPGKSEIDDRHWQLLRAENEQYLHDLGNIAWKSRTGIAAIVVLITIMLCGYIARYQPKIIRKHPRAIAIAALMVLMLLIGQLAGVGSSPMYVFGIAPSILVAMIMVIAYDQRFAMGIASLHAVLVTIALGQGLGFLIILICGVMTCCYMLDDIRTRSKLIEVGGAASIAMMIATVAVGLINLDPMQFIARNCLFTGAAGLAVGFIVLGILPFIEKAFRITTSMTLLELADASHPLLRRLAVEAPGTYNHSLQVATIAEAAAEAIHSNSLLCRVASYYHDVGKINKSDYFCENQTNGANRHLNLSPSVSLLIIIGHVKDGIELAKEYKLPTSIFPFIQQHHGTTLVEFFYYQACTKNDQATEPAISEQQYRYPGPRPRTKEAAIIMIADAVESATRAMPEPNSGRIESLVRDISRKRLLDGQFDECDITMRELEQVERSCVKSLLGIYHGRIAYPSTVSIQSPAQSAVTRVG